MVLGSVVSKYCAKSVFFDENLKLFFYINFFFDTNPSFYASLAGLPPSYQAYLFRTGAILSHTYP